VRNPVLNPGPHARIALAAALVAFIAGCGGSDGGDATPLQIHTLSTRADMVTGGDALVEIVAPAGAQPSSLQVSVDGRNVTSAFSTRSDGRIVGLVTGLANGTNTLQAEMAGARAATLQVTNASRQGPVISGAQVVPFYCATPSPQAASGNTPATNGSGLSGQPDASCNVAAETKLYYRTTAAAQSAANPSGCTLGLPDPAWNVSGTATTLPAAPALPANGCFKPYTAGAPAPADMATTTTDAGTTVPFIVRVERGVINRGIYDIAVLFDPSKSWSANAPQAAWNGKVYYNFGASTGQPRRQQRPATAWSGSEEQLKRGWMVVANGMTDSARNSNRVLMSETVMMMKEHIADTYGAIRYTLGTGCSGGSINSNMNASINPGLLDGIVTSCTYPDSETTSIEVGDCVVLVEAYQKPELLNLWAGLSAEQVNAKKAAINGHPDQSACHGWYNAFGSNGKAGVYFQRLVTNNVTGSITQATTATNNCELPNSAVYDPANPAATANLPRCNAWSWAESIWGKVPGSPAARDTRDNVGVQYGLKALREGRITAEEFVTLNEIVGGNDRDSTPRAQRSTADGEALEIAYRAGIVASGKQLAKTPIIDLRGWDDSNVTVPPGLTPGAIPIHHQWFSWAVRDRIVREAGDANNQALWRFARTGLAAPGTLGLEAFLAMDQWLFNIAADTSSASREQKVRSARPTSGARDTRDFCLLPSDPAQTNRVFDMAVCDADPFLSPSLSPRQVAGGPRSEDVLKCQLKPLSVSDYGSAAAGFTAQHMLRLDAVFPNGVCDWSKPGVGQQLAVSPLTFRAAPGGQPIGAAPVSQAR
jgi:hypothetical protein